LSSPRNTARARAALLNDLFTEVALTYFRLQAEADRLTGSRELAPGKLGILRTLHEDGPSTVPAIARSRPVARQGVQKNADALAEDGLVEYEDNPQHRRSKLLRLTPRGEKRYLRARDAQLAWASWIDDGTPSDRALSETLRTLRWCRDIFNRAGAETP
jgi:DNA-binding MarR family transcriptional regulator